jgi:hypothetical protein
MTEVTSDLHPSTPVVGALPRQVLNRQFAALNSGEDRAASVFSDYSGATTLRYLTQVLREFVIPPGTVMGVIAAAGDTVYGFYLYE